jgi:outer membrane receptor protein involved in Fe transport
VSVLFGVTDGRFEIPNRPGQTPSFMLAGAPPVDSAALDANQRERNRFAALSYQGTVGADVDYQLSLFTRTSEVHYMPDPVGDLVFNGIAADITRLNVAGGLQGDLAWRLGNAHTLRTGLFAQREHFTVGNTSRVFPADANGNQTSDMPITIVDDSSIDGHLWGAYVQDEWQAAKALTVNYGLRYDQVATVVDENQWSPRLGLVYDWTPNLRVHAGYARYFTPPPTEKIDTTSVQKFLGTTNALPSDANTAVKSERSNYYDAGVAWQATPQLTLGADAYYRDVKHLQDEGQFGNALIFSAFNYERGRIGGLELTGTYKEKRWSAYGNLAFSRALGKNIETGQFNFSPDELAYISQNWVHLDHDQTVAASTGVSVRVGDGWTVLGDALYGSGLRRGFANTEHLPSYTQVNAAVERTFDTASPFGRFDTRLSLINVFDRVYELRDGTGIGVGAPQFGPRRSVYLTMGKNF